MAEKLRSVNTKFWKDPFIEELNISEKLLFLYILTNPDTNILGIYETSIKRISYETGLTKETILKAFEGFGMVQKAYFKNNFVILPNFLKNQRLNSNMKTGAAKIFNDLPEWLKSSILGNDSKELSNDSKGFETLLNALLKYEIEIGNKKEEKGNKKKEIVYSFDEFWEKYPNKIGKKDCQKIYSKLSGEEIEKIKNTIDTFVNYKPFKDYTHPHPKTYLNQKRWEDEINDTKKVTDKKHELSHEAFVHIPKERHSEITCRDDEVRILTELYPEYGN